MKRTIALGAAWTVSAAAAVGLGFLAVSFVDTAASPGPEPTAASTAPTRSPLTTPSSTTTSSPAAAESSARAAAESASAAAARMSEREVPFTAEQVTAGGTVFADCAINLPVVAAVPAAGWRVDNSGDSGTVAFERGEAEVAVTVHCIDGSPYFTFEDSASPTRSQDDSDD